MVEIRIDSSSFEKGLKKLLKLQSRRVAEVGVEALMAEARKRAPFRFGELRDSDLVQSAQNRSADGARFATGHTIKFGFNKKYAAVMDRGFRVQRIRAVKADYLYIPLSRKAARLGPKKSTRRRTKAGGSVTSGSKSRTSRKSRSSKGRKGRAKEVLFLKSVKAPKARKGSKKGPNFYFSGTIKDFSRSGKLGKILAAAAAIELRKAASNK